MKFKLWENLNIKILWDYIKSINHKIQYISQYNYYKVDNYMIKLNQDINLLLNKLKLLWKEYYRV